MLSKENRLKKSKDVKQVLKQGAGRKSRFLFLKFQKKESGLPRFGFIVSKKVSNKAVVRNKVKRRLRESVRIFIKEVQKPADCVFIAFSGIEQRSFQEIKSEVEGLLKKADLLS